MSCLVTVEQPETMYKEQQMITANSFVRSLGSVLPRLVDSDTLAGELDLQTETVQLAAKAGVFPYYPITKKTVRFDLNECRAILQAKMRQCGMANGKGPPEKNEAAAATTARDYDAQKEVYKIVAGKSRRKSYLLSFLFNELLAMESTLRMQLPGDFEQRIVQSLRRATIKKLEAII